MYLSARQQAAGVKAIERFDMSAELRVQILSRMPPECDKSLRGKDMRGTPRSTCHAMWKPPPTR